MQNKCQTNDKQMPNNVNKQTPRKQMPYKCQTNAKPMPDKCKTNANQYTKQMTNNIPNKYQTNTKQMPKECQTIYQANA